MDKRYENFCDGILLRQILCAAVIIAVSQAGLLAADSFAANAPQFDGLLSSPSSSLPAQSPSRELSDQPPLIDEKSSIKNSTRPRRPEKPSKYSGGLSIWRSMLSLVLVLLLIVGGSFLLRRFMPSTNRFSKNSGLEVLARCAIGAKQSICLVKMGPRLVLIGLSPNHMAALDVVNDPEDIAMILGRIEASVPDSISRSFGQYFRQESGQFNEKSDEQPPTLEKDDLAEVRQVHLARHELSGLLEKVKGLTRLRGRY